MFVFKFFGLDGEFEYTIGEAADAFWHFRNPRCYGLSWTFDGDGWSSSETVFDSGHVGNYYIGLKA